jgi:hypothetical protein
VRTLGTICAIAGLLIVAAVNTSTAQILTADSVKSQDTVIYVPNMEQHPAGDVTNKVNLEKHLIQNPTIALFKSMFVPGWGQFGNRRVIKGTVIIGLQTWFGYEAIKYGRQTHDAWASYQGMSDETSLLHAYSIYTNKRSSRNKYIWFFGLTAMVSMFDAYVDAHLSGAPTNPRNDQFTIDVVPDVHGGATAQLALRF